jgi:hypothetical protein
VLADTSTVQQHTPYPEQSSKPYNVHSPHTSLSDIQIERKHERVQLSSELSVVFRIILGFPNRVGEKKKTISRQMLNDQRFYLA